MDVDSIPLSAIDRVEILNDGASAIYGSDAVAGVVNFILRRDCSGGELALDAGNILLLPGGNVGGNPSTPTCPAQFAIDTPFTAGSGFCAFDPSPLVTLLQATDRASLMAAGKCVLSPSLEASFEASYTQSKQRVVIQPVPLSFAFALPPNNPLGNLAPWNGNDPAEYGRVAGTPHGLGSAVSTILLRPGTPFYPTAYVQSLLNPGEPLRPLTVVYRSSETGNRVAVRKRAATTAALVPASSTSSAPISSASTWSRSRNGWKTTNNGTPAWRSRSSRRRPRWSGRRRLICSTTASGASSLPAPFCVSSPSACSASRQLAAAASSSASTCTLRAGASPGAAARSSGVPKSKLASRCELCGRK